MTLVQYFLTRRWDPSCWVPVTLNRLREVVCYYLAACCGIVVGMLISSFALWTYFGHKDPLPLLMFRWFTSDGIIHSTFVPFLLQLRLVQLPRKWRITGSTILVILTILVLPLPIWLTTYLVDYSFATVMGLYIAFPLVIVVFISGGPFLGTLITNLVTITSIIILFFHQYNPSPVPLDDRIAAVMVFLMVMSIASLFISAVVCERNEALENVENQVRTRTRELRVALEQLERANNETEKLSKQKSDFMVSYPSLDCLRILIVKAFLCHELRNPLHAILNLASDDKDQSPAFDTNTSTTIVSYCQHMMSLLSDGTSLFFLQILTL